MTTFFILLRLISPYSGANIVLGVFDAEANAINAKLSYLRQYRILEQQPAQQHWFRRVISSLLRKPLVSFSCDPWHRQAYVKDGITEDALVIDPVAVVSEIEANEVFVVSAYCDSLGLLTREIDSVHGNRISAELRLAELESEADATVIGEAMPNNAFSVQQVTLNVLQSDRPEDQPVR